MVIFIMLCAMMGYSTPTWMWVGTYDIDNDPCYGSLDAIVTGNGFFSSALARHPSGPTPNRYINGTNQQVCANNINNSSREMCDFIFVGGHGSPLGQSIWNNSGTTCTGWFSTLQYGVGGGDPYATAMNLGTNYVRWAYFCGCHVLKNPPTSLISIFQGWAPAFQGVQCILGYASMGWISSYYSPAQVDEFWQLWTATDIHGNPTGQGQVSLWQAHWESTGDQLYNSIYHISVEPAVICGSTPPTIIGGITYSGTPYCNFNYTNSTSVKAATGFANGGTWSQVTFGNPS